MSDFKTFVALGMAPALAKEVDEGIQNGGANAVQKDGGIASRTVVQATGATASRVAGDRAADTRSVEDFIGESLTEQIIAADAAGRGMITVPAGTNMVLDGSDALSAANKSVWKSDDKKLVDEQQGNRGNYVHWSAYGSAPNHFSPTLRSWQLPQAGRAAQETGSVKFINVGDSIIAVAADPCEAAIYVNGIIEMMRRDNPGVDIDWINAAVGGTTWGDFAGTHPAMPWLDPTTNQTWKDWVAAQAPDVVLLHFGGNDVPNFSAVDVISAITFLQALPKVPDIIVGITYRPSYSKDVMPGEEFLKYYTTDWQKAFQAAIGWTRTYCQANGIPYIDFDRYVSVGRDGYDPEDVGLSTIVPQAGTSMPAYNAWTKGVANGNSWDWDFPAIQSPTGTMANACTDYSYTMRLDTLPTMLIYTLDNGSNGVKISRPNSVYIWFNDASGKLVYSYSDGVKNPDTTKIITDVPIPTNVSANNPILCAFEAIGARVRFRIFVPFVNYTAYAPGALDKFGTGETVVLDLLTARNLSPITPRVTFVGSASAQMMPLRMCVGDRSRNCQDVHRYVPNTPCYDLYSIIGTDTTAIGGSLAFHMNTTGIRDMQWRAIRDQEWHFPVETTDSDPSVNTITVSGTGGVSVFGKKPDGQEGAFQWFDTGGYNVAIDPGSSDHPGQFIWGYKNGSKDPNVGSNGLVSMCDLLYAYTHFTAHVFNNSVYLGNKQLGVAIQGSVATTVINATTAAPTKPSDPGQSSEFRIDDNYLYFYRNGKWRRVPFDGAWS
ncbi:hypothetical protein AD954_01260 [Acetobacter cerevisiae]|uniref:SGNH hydrolase-type esterase domain-containing protein n=2 Tax=Acetobacter cerevisiae TaxID=178900 RepID=A0A149VF24_9PROT|nr:hypothetical protein AD954_01260 [Acetobacter cerevisiae]